MGIHDGHRERLKTEFLAHSDSMPDHKLLELLLFYCNPRKDTNPIAHNLINHCGSLSGVLDADPNKLLEVPDIGQHAVLLLKVVKEIANYYVTMASNEDNKVDSLLKVKQLLEPYLFGAKQEQAYLICMDSKGKLLGIREIVLEDAKFKNISPRKVLEAALSLNSEQVILAHNQIAEGIPPSEDDCRITKLLYQLLAVSDVVLSDHLIFLGERALSMRRTGFFEEFRNVPFGY